MRVRFVADWHSFWVGFFVDPVLHRLYVQILPMLAICFIPGEASNQQSRLHKLLGRKEIIYRNWVCRVFGHKMKVWTLDRKAEAVPLQTCLRCGLTKPHRRVGPTEPLPDPPPPPPRGRVVSGPVVSHCSVCGNRLTVECGNLCSKCTQERIRQSQMGKKRWSA